MGVQTLQGIQNLALQAHINRVILEKAASLDFACFESAAFAQRIYLVRDRASASVQGFLASFGAILVGVVTLVSMLMIVCSLSPWVMSGIILCSLPTVHAVRSFARHRFNLMTLRVKKLMSANYLSWLLTSRDAAKEVRLLGLQQLLLARFDASWKQFIAENQSLALKVQKMQFLVRVPAVIGLLGSWIYAAQKAVSGQISIGSMTMYFQAAKAFSEGLEQILATGGGFYENTLFLGKLFEFLDLDSAKTEGALRQRAGVAGLPVPRPIRLGLEFRNVSFRYPGASTETLHDLSFKIAPGERVAIVGANGAGKSTIVKLLTRLYDPTSGSILLDGHPLEEYRLDEVRSLFSVLFQDFIKYQLSVADNIGFGQASEAENRARIMRAAREVGCLQLIEKLPQGLDTILGRTLAEGVDISGGEWQLLGLARTSMRDAQVVILDEPTAALDPHSERNVLTNINAFSERTTCILISHRPSTVKFMERVLVIKGGRLVEDRDAREGAPPELKVSACS